MKWANQKKSNVRIISEFFSLQYDSIEDIASVLSIGDNTLELLTLRLVQDKMELNRYFVLTPETYQECKAECKLLLA